MPAIVYFSIHSNITSREANNNTGPIGRGSEYTDMLADSVLYVILPFGGQCNR